TQEICLELQDHSRAIRSAVEFFGSKNSADPQAQAARLADQFIKQNSPIFQLLQVDIHRDYDGTDVLLNIESHSAVGAVPLLYSRALLVGHDARRKCRKTGHSWWRQCPFTYARMYISAHCSPRPWSSRAAEIP